MGDDQGSDALENPPHNRAERTVFYFMYLGAWGQRPQEGPGRVLFFGVWFVLE